MVASLLERQPTLIPRYNFHLPEPLRSCGVVWGNGDVMFTGEAGTGPLSLEAQWQGGLVQADPKGPGQTDFFRLLTGAQGTFGVVTWAAVRCELVPAAHEYLFAAAAELDELVDFTYRLDRIRLGDEVLIVNDAYLARLLESRGRGRRPGRAARVDARPRARRPRALRRRARRRPEEGRAGAGRRVRRDAAAGRPRRGHRRHRRGPRRLLRRRRGSSPRRAPAPTCSSSPRSRRRPPSSRSPTSSPTATATPPRTSASTSSRSTRA